jgi:hypothetical protein
MASTCVCAPLARRHIRATVVMIAAILVTSAASAFAQQGQATLTGTVVDNAGVVPGATVTITNTATAAVRTATTDGTGVFRIPTVLPGQYSIKVEMRASRN